MNYLDYNTIRLLDVHQDASDFRYYLTRIKVNALWHIYAKPKEFFTIPKRSKRTKRSRK